MIEKRTLCAEYLNRHIFPRNSRRPVTWDEGTPIGKTTKIYVSASWYEQWPDWKTQADIAREAHCLEFDRFNDFFVKGGSSYPLSGDPKFLLEKSAVFASGYEIWINVCCPGADEFQRTLAEAKRRISGYQNDSELRAADLDPLPMLPIPSIEFQVEPVNMDVVQLLESL